MLHVILNLLIIFISCLVYKFALIVRIQRSSRDPRRVLRSIKMKTGVPLHPIPARVWMIKNIFYYISLIRLGLWGSSSGVKGGCYPVLSLCQPVLVTWLTTQLKCRNGVWEATAHNYKLCDKRYFSVPVFNGLEVIVSKNCAIRFESMQFSGPDQPGRYPPPHEKLSGLPPTPPLLLSIICSLLENPFLSFIRLQLLSVHFIRYSFFPVVRVSCYSEKGVWGMKKYLDDYDLPILCCKKCPLDPKTRWCGWAGEDPCDIWKQKRRSFEKNKEKFEEEYGAC